MNIHPMTQCLLRTYREDDSFWFETGQLTNLKRYTRTLPETYSYQIYTLTNPTILVESKGDQV